MAGDASSEQVFAWQTDNRVVEKIQRRVGGPPRGTSFLRLLGADAKAPAWLTKGDPIAQIFAQQGRIVRDGLVRWAHVVQANVQAFSPGKVDHGAQVVYAPGGDVPLLDLKTIAHRAFALKGTKPIDPDESRIAQMLTSELERALDWQLPLSLTDGRCVVTTIVLLPREFLPAGFLTINCFPIFADPTTRMATLVPSKYWPAEMQEDWEKAAQKIAEQAYPVKCAVASDGAPAEEIVFTRAVELTPAAGARVRAILWEKGLKYGRLNVGVIEREGGFAYDLKFTKDKPDVLRQFTYESQGVPIVIDKIHVGYLRGTWIDFRDDGPQKGFVFLNPNAAKG